MLSISSSDVGTRLSVSCHDVGTRLSIRSNVFGTRLSISSNDFGTRQLLSVDTSISAVIMFHLAGKMFRTICVYQIMRFQVQDKR